LECYAWIGCETTRSIARSKACGYLFRKEPGNSCVSVYWRFRPQLAPKFTKCAIPRRWWHKVDSADAGNLESRLVPRRGIESELLKASEDIQMPIPAVDYWLRVRRHQREEDFQEYAISQESK